MEVAGLVIGGVSLAGLFTTCVDCFEYVQFGRQFGKDYQTAIIRLDLIRLRLSRWGNAVNESGNYISAQSEEEVIKVKEILGQIIYLFGDAEKISERFRSSKGGTDVQTVADMGANIESLHLSMKNLALKRQNRSGFVQKTSWALYEGKHFNRLIEDVDPLVRDLVEMFPAAKEKQQQLSIEEAQQLQDEEAIDTLQKANDGQDDLLRESIATVLASQGGHRFVRNEVGDNVRARYGDEMEGEQEAKGAMSTYEENKAQGNARVHYGNRYGQRSILDD